MNKEVWERCLKNRERLAKKFLDETKMKDVFSIKRSLRSGGKVTDSILSQTAKRKPRIKNSVSEPHANNTVVITEEPERIHNAYDSESANTEDSVRIDKTEDYDRANNSDEITEDSESVDNSGEITEEFESVNSTDGITEDYEKINKDCESTNSPDQDFVQLSKSNESEMTENNPDNILSSAQDGETETAANKSITVDDFTTRVVAKNGDFFFDIEPVGGPISKNQENENKCFFCRKICKSKGGLELHLNRT
jgi:hypothetical protein